MGYSRRKVKRLPEKLKAIRAHLGLSQSKLLKLLGEDLSSNYISKFELGKNEPDLEVLLAYARIAGVPLDQLADDKLDLDLPYKRSARDSKHD
jgi:transcriptional regulator with XRE-family HTH domain